MTHIQKLLYVIVAVMAFGVAVKYLVVRGVDKTLYEAPLGNSVGPADAKDVIVEFLDYRCQTCRQAAPVIEEFHRRNPGVRIVFRYLPISGEESLRAATLALAAGKEGRFPDMHDLLLRRDLPVTDADIDALAQQVGLNPGAVRLNMLGREADYAMVSSQMAALVYGLKAVPSFIVNGTAFKPGAGGLSVEALEEALNRRREGGGE